MLESLSLKYDGVLFQVSIWIFGGSGGQISLRRGSGSGWRGDPSAPTMGGVPVSRMGTIRPTVWRTGSSTTPSLGGQMTSAPPTLTTGTIHTCQDTSAKNRNLYILSVCRFACLYASLFLSLSISLSSLSLLSISLLFSLVFLSICQRLVTKEIFTES